MQTLPRDLHAAHVGRADYAKAGMSALWKTDDDVGKGGWVKPCLDTFYVHFELDETTMRGRLDYAPASAWGSGGVNCKPTGTGRSRLVAHV